METARYKFIVFDFDGTLVDTASAKREAFFQVLPASCHAAVESVLSADPDGSRHSVIPAMLEDASRRGIDVSAIDADTVIAAYSDAVKHAVNSAADVAGVQDVLAWAADVGSVYIFSMTPEKELSSAVSRRNWHGYISETFGFPADKEEVLAGLLQHHDAYPEEVLVVGDGQSDRAAAAAHGCHFYQISQGRPLTGIVSQGGAR